MRMVGPMWKKMGVKAKAQSALAGKVQTKNIEKETV
jgi:hypothetical protein